MSPKTKKDPKNSEAPADVPARRTLEGLSDRYEKVMAWWKTVYSVYLSVMAPYQERADALREEEARIERRIRELLEEKNSLTKSRHDLIRQAEESPEVLPYRHKLERLSSVASGIRDLIGRRVAEELSAGRLERKKFSIGSLDVSVSERVERVVEDAVPFFRLLDQMGVLSKVVRRVDLSYNTAEFNRFVDLMRPAGVVRTEVVKVTVKDKTEEGGA